MSLPLAIAAVSFLGAALAICDLGACEEDAAGATHLLQTQMGQRPRSTQLLQLKLHGRDLPPTSEDMIRAYCSHRACARENHFDMNGKVCLGCDDLPLPARSDREYVQRTDCGNYSTWENPENFFKPVVQFNHEAKDGQPETTAYCELNFQKMCADSIYNKDFLMQAKTVIYPKDLLFDPYYCYHNGWLAPEIKALQHDFEGMKTRAEQECNARQYDNITLADAIETSRQGSRRASLQPTEDEAWFVGSWTCAMGSAACDMAYCAYSFCELPDGTIGSYDDCEGWDPVKGMPFLQGS